MDKDELLKKLNWFYSLELNQVDLYLAQGKNEEPNISVVYERIADIEQGHADALEAQIHKLGAVPNKLSDMIFPLLGNLAGSALSLSGTKNECKADILLEQHAIKEYRNMIEQLKLEYPDPELIKLMEYNCVDEELHTAWFGERLNKLH